MGVTSRRRGGLLAVLIVGLMVAALLPASADSTKGGGGNDLVMLGDSYSSGEGLSDSYYADSETATNECHRSSKAWPALVRDGLFGVGNSWVFAACSGDSTGNMSSSSIADNDLFKQSQLSLLSSETDRVTLTIGGNDLNFPGVLRQCTKVINSTLGIFGGGGVVQSKDKECADQKKLTTDVLGGREIDESEIAQRLLRLYREILDRAPNAKLTIATYPMIFPDESYTGRTVSGIKYCETAAIVAGKTFVAFTAADVTLFRDWQIGMNSRIQTVVDRLNADGLGGRIALVRFDQGELATHTIDCGDAGRPTPYMNAVRFAPNSGAHTEYISKASFHPNEAGHAAFAAVFRSAIIAADAGVPGWQGTAYLSGRPAASGLPITCLSGGYCWIAMETGEILHSADGGATFASQFLPSDGRWCDAWGNCITPKPEFIDCPDRYHCVAGGHTGGVVRTADGGQSWTATSSGGYQADINGGGLEDLECPSITTCFALGRSPDAEHVEAHLLSSFDGGATWTAASIADLPHGSELACPTTTRCFALGYADGPGGVGSSGEVPLLFRTDDGGGSWTRLNPTPGNIDDGAGFSGAELACPTANFCMTAQPHSVGGVVVTEDGGDTWHTTDLTEEGLAISCGAARACTVTTINLTGNELAFTVDAGERWQAEKGVGHGPRLSCPSSVECWAVSHDDNSGAWLVSHVLRTA